MAQISYQKILWVYLAGLYFWENAFLMIPPTLPWCLSLQNQHNYLFKNIVPANNWKINPDGNWAPIPSLHKKTLMNDLPHSVSTVSIAFFRQLIEVILLFWVFGHHDYTFIPYLVCCTFRITTLCKKGKALISLVGALDFILLIISIALSKIGMN